MLAKVNLEVERLLSYWGALNLREQLLQLVLTATVNQFVLAFEWALVCFERAFAFLRFKGDFLAHFSNLN